MDDLCGNFATFLTFMTMRGCRVGTVKDTRGDLIISHLVHGHGRKVHTLRANFTIYTERILKIRGILIFALGVLN